MRSPDFRPPGVTVRSSVQSGWTGDKVRTDVAGFLGFAERGPAQLPVRIESWDEYRTFFGGHVRGAYLSRAVHGFFANGGTACWVVRLASEPSWGNPRGRHEQVVGIEGAGGRLRDLAGAPSTARLRLLLRAVSPGTWGRNIAASLVPIDSSHYSLTLRCPGAETEVLEGLSIAELAQAINAGRDQRAPADGNALRDGASNLVRALPQIAVQRPPSAAGDPRPTIVLEFCSYEAWGSELRVGVQPDGSIRVYSRPAPSPSQAEPAAAVASAVEWSSFEVSSTAGLRTGFELTTPIGAVRLRVEGDVSAPDGFAQGGPVGAPDGPVDGDTVDDARWVDPTTGLALLDRVDSALGLGGAPLARRAARGLQLFEDIEEIGMVAFPDACIAFGLPRSAHEIHDLGDHSERAEWLRLDAANDTGALEGLRELTDDNREDAAARVRDVQRALIEHCERLGDRIALLDVPLTIDRSLSPSQWIAPDVGGRRPRLLDSSYAALYFPWLLVQDAVGDEVVAVPPSGHIAGLLARLERTTGVHRSPANLALLGCVDTDIEVRGRNHAELNDLGVNVLLALGPRGVRPMGARTLSTGRGAGRYLAVRRLLNWVTESLEVELAWTVFEPSGPRLWEEVERVVRAFLQRIWRRGMLDGEVDSEAFHVRCDGGLNALDTDRLVCEIGLQPPLPAEYVTVQVVRLAGRSTVHETEDGGGHG